SPSTAGRRMVEVNGISASGRTGHVPRRPEGAALAWQPNFAYNLLASRVKDAEIEGVDLGSMRGFSNCSEPVRASSHEAFYQRFRGHGVKREALWVCYALAENAFAVTTTSHAVPVVVCGADPAELARGAVRPAAERARSCPIVSCGT